MSDLLFALTGSFDLSREVEDSPLIGELFAGLEVEPRPYQHRIVSKAVQMLCGEYVDRSGETCRAADSVMIESPTGSGKTVMGLAVGRELHRRYGWQVGWVAMRRNLLAQAASENHRRGFDLGLTTISMFDRNPPMVDVLIVDEAQHDAAMSMANMHATLRPKKVLGLTATPFRTDRIKLCFDRVIKDAGIHQLIQDGYLSPYHHFTIPEYTPATVASFYAAEQQRWGKTLIFFHRKDQAMACQQELRNRGVRSEVVTATSPRERQLADFEAGRIQVLINMAILTEGFDCPSLKTVFCRPSGKSCTIQMAGRVFRKHSTLPFKQVVQCKKSKHPMIRSAIAERQFAWVEGEWRSLTLNEQIDDVASRVRKILATIDVELPKVVADNRPSRGAWRSQYTFE